jgi:hypothetical protein
MIWQRSPWLRYGVLVLAISTLVVVVAWGLVGWVL